MEADFCYLVARTNLEAPAHAGLSEFVVDMRSQGVSVAPIRDATGTDDFCLVSLDDVVVDDDCLIGTLDESFRQVMRQLEYERGGIDRLVSNRALYRDALASEYFNRDDPLLRDEAAAIEAHYRIGRLLVLREVLGQAPRGFSALTKTFCADLEQRISNFCARVVGAHAIGGLNALGSRVARNATYSCAYTIMGGTSLVLRNVIAERLLGLPRAAFGYLTVGGRSETPHPSTRPADGGNPTRVEHWSLPR
jgi:alkylation response protein AidB-like acyl-CoA dehydrogenase